MSKYGSLPLNFPRGQYPSFRTRKTLYPKTGSRRKTLYPKAGPRRKTLRKRRTGCVRKGSRTTAWSDDSAIKRPNDRVVAARAVVKPRGSPVNHVWLVATRSCPGRLTSSVCPPVLLVAEVGMLLEEVLTTCRRQLHRARSLLLPR